MSLATPITNSSSGSVPVLAKRLDSPIRTGSASPGRIEAVSVAVPLTVTVPVPASTGIPFTPASPEPILFEQSLAWVNDEGKAIRYRTLYTEGYADWRFPQPTAPPHMLRDLDASREQPPRPPR